MENQLQEVKEQFIEELFEMMKIQAKCNNNNLFDYYNLIIANIDKHNNMFENIFENGFEKLDYNKDSLGYDDGEISIYLNNNTHFKIKLIREYDNVFDIYRRSYNITKTSNIAEVLEEDTNPNILHKIKIETENKLKGLRLQQKQDKLNQMLKERKQLELDIEVLQKELAFIS
ncbi:TPA: hypothetical protein PTV74_003171 [Clostridium botulinum]|nr:hypothetical protein [Clostridium botulinum]HDK7206326.1 hypothetical protein [Clostridium botulinum]HDK7210062.1 hypothetical protein [Clostridium botulinum]HDK7265511.1 hypothetical protein [Clostridium botulinum]HDK7269359.1 hypothetical protein [Clostridium botulinum]